MILSEAENLNHQQSHPDAWVCVCGNDPTDQGFYPCDINGDNVEPAAEQCKSALYLCKRCGQIIHEEILEMVGVIVSRAKQDGRNHFDEVSALMQISLRDWLKFPPRKK